MDRYDLEPSTFARDFVAGNESGNQPGRIGDGGYGVGTHQLDTRYGFRPFFGALSPHEQDMMLPDRKAREEIFHPDVNKARPLNPIEQKSVSEYMASPMGYARQTVYYDNKYRVPAMQLATLHSPGINTTPEMEALTLDMVTQRGVSKVRGLLGGQGQLTPGQLVGLEIQDLSSLAKTKPGGAATILHRRVVRGAHKLGVNINPTHVYRALFEIIKSPKWDKLEPRDKKRYMGMLKETLQTTRERYSTSARGNTSMLTVLGDMLGIDMPKPKTQSTDDKIRALFEGGYDLE